MTFVPSNITILIQDQRSSDYLAALLANLMYSVLYTSLVHHLLDSRYHVFVH